MRTKIATVAAVAFASTAFIAGTAQASVNTAVCGSSYFLVGSYQTNGVEMNAYGANITDTKTDMGSIDLYYSNSTGLNCAVMHPIASLEGSVSNISVWIQNDSTGALSADPSGGSTANYHYYAGPVYISAPHTCVGVGGDFLYGNYWWLVNADGLACG